MAKLVVTEFVSLDGVMEAPGGEDFKYPGWTFEFDRGEDGNQFKLEEALESDALLLGRITYESFAGAWPTRDGEFAEKFNSMPKYVVSSTLEAPEWNNTRFSRATWWGLSRSSSRSSTGSSRCPGASGWCRRSSRAISSTSCT